MDYILPILYPVISVGIPDNGIEWRISYPVKEAVISGNILELFKKIEPLAVI